LILSINKLNNGFYDEVKPDEEKRSADMHVYSEV